MNSSYLIGIAGGSGSGKTTFLRSLMAHYSTDQVALVSQDNYYKPKEQQEKDENGWVNFDLPGSIDRDHFLQDVMQLRRGASIEKLEYNFNNPEWEPKHITVHSAPIILVEGLFVFHFEEIMELLDYKVFLNAPHEERLSRRIRRDLLERGYPEEEVLYQWHNHVRPAEEKYLYPYLEHCDLEIDNVHAPEVGVEILLQKVKLHFEPGHTE